MRTNEFLSRLWRRINFSTQSLLLSLALSCRRLLLLLFEIYYRGIQRGEDCKSKQIDTVFGLYVWLSDENFVRIQQMWQIYSYIVIQIIYALLFCRYYSWVRPGSWTHCVMSITWRTSAPVGQYVDAEFNALTM